MSNVIVTCRHAPGATCTLWNLQVTTAADLKTRMSWRNSHDPTLTHVRGHAVKGVKECKEKKPSFVKVGTGYTVTQCIRMAKTACSFSNHRCTDMLCLTFVTTLFQEAIWEQGNTGSWLISFGQAWAERANGCCDHAMRAKDQAPSSVGVGCPTSNSCLSNRVNIVFSAHGINVQRALYVYTIDCMYFYWHCWGFGSSPLVHHL